MKNRFFTLLNTLLIIGFILNTGCETGESSSQILYTGSEGVGVEFDKMDLADTGEFLEGSYIGPGGSDSTIYKQRNGPTWFEDQDDAIAYFGSPSKGDIVGAYTEEQIAIFGIIAGFLLGGVNNPATGEPLGFF